MGCVVVIGAKKIINFSIILFAVFVSVETILLHAVYQSCVPNLKSQASAVAKILKGSHKFRGAPLAQGHTHFSSSGFYDGP